MKGVVNFLYIVAFAPVGRCGSSDRKSLPVAARGQRYRRRESLLSGPKGVRMSDRIRVDPDDLLISGAKVDGHAWDVHATHAAADARIDSELAGWAGSSLAAMTAKAAKWQGVTAALSERLLDHALALRASGIGFQQTEDDNARAVDAVGSEAMRTPFRE
jgi:WXG100 family type VII secretion target